MEYRTIAVHADEFSRASVRIRLAAELAARHGAHLAGVATVGMLEACYASAMPGGAAMAAAYIEMLEERAKLALARFENLARQTGVESTESHLIREETGVALCLQARYSDLLVLGQADPDEAPSSAPADFVPYVMLHAGRPVLIVPYAGEFANVGRRVVVAWDGGNEAAHAISAALPLFERAEQVQVVVFNPEVGARGHGEQPGADIALFLARHGVKVEVAQQAAGDDRQIGIALLSHLADYGADLLVMGGYGHSRFREIMLGGVTRTILQSMTAPVLMMH